jgi:hypothetical protein
MINKAYNSTIIIGITLSYIILGFSYHELYLDGQKDVRLLDSIGYSLFQITHVLLFTRIYLSKKIRKFKILLLIPILVQMIDLIPIEFLHSLKFTLISILSVIIGWLILLINLNINQQKKFYLLIIIGMLSLLFRWTPSAIVLYSLDNSSNALYHFGLEVLKFDRFKLIEKSGIINLSISDSLYLLTTIYLVISYKFGVFRKQFVEKKI